MTVHPELAAAFPDPIATYVDELATAADIPVVALGACLVRYDEAGPLLRQVLTRVTNRGSTSDSEAVQLFRTLHIVGGARDSLSFSPLLRLLQGPKHEVDRLLGDAAIETLPRIIAGVFDGNADELFRTIGNRELDWTIRDSLLRAATFLTWEGRIDRALMIAFLEEFATAEPAQDDDMVWATWTDAIALLGLHHLEPLVSEAEKRGLLDNDLFERHRFEAMLAHAAQAPAEKSRFEEANLGYIDDVLAALQLFPSGYNDEESGPVDWQDIDDEPIPQPATNPWRHVGRNDPCPCGSGKKAKRCCLAA